MLNRTSLPSSLPANLDPKAVRALGAARWRVIAETFVLPESRRDYLLFLLGIIILAGTMSIHVMLSADVMRLELRLSDLKQEHARIERQNANLIWEISQHGALSEVYAQAAALGYIPVETRESVFKPATATLPASSGAVGTATNVAGEQDTDGAVFEWRRLPDTLRDSAYETMTWLGESWLGERLAAARIAITGRFSPARR